MAEQPCKYAVLKAHTRRGCPMCNPDGWQTEYAAELDRAGSSEEQADA